MELGFCWSLDTCSILINLALQISSICRILLLYTSKHNPLNANQQLQAFTSLVQCQVPDHDPIERDSCYAAPPSFPQSLGQALSEKMTLENSILRHYPSIISIMPSSPLRSSGFLPLNWRHDTNRKGAPFRWRIPLAWVVESYQWQWFPQSTPLCQGNKSQQDMTLNVASYALPPPTSRAATLIKA